MGKTYQLTFPHQTIRKYCFECHGPIDAVYPLPLNDLKKLSRYGLKKEKTRVIDKLTADETGQRQMPPSGYRRPSDREYQLILREVESAASLK